MSVNALAPTFTERARNVAKPLQRDLVQPGNLRDDDARVLTVLNEAFHHGTK
jgi:hypothetical protein